MNKGVPKGFREAAASIRARRRHQQEAWVTVQDRGSHAGARLLRGLVAKPPRVLGGMKERPDLGCSLPLRGPEAEYPALGVGRASPSRSSPGLRLGRPRTCRLVTVNL